VSSDPLANVFGQQDQLALKLNFCISTLDTGSNSFFSNVILLNSCEFSVNIISSNVDKLQDDSFWLMFLALTGSFWMYSRVGINTLASNNVGQINDIIHGIFMAFNGI